MNQIMTENLTLDYYNGNSESYASSTVSADMSVLCDEFLSLIPDGVILDLGCGSGRDSKYFLSHGRNVISVDGSNELCRLAGEFLGHEVICADFRDYTPTEFLRGFGLLRHCFTLKMEKFCESSKDYRVLSLTMEYSTCHSSTTKMGNSQAFGTEDITRILTKRESHALSIMLMDSKLYG